MKVVKWGNSLAVRLPSALVTELSLKAGDDVEFRVIKANQYDAGKTMSREEALERLAAFRYTLPADYKFDREEANER
jgi:antitoxin MazE